MSPEVGMDGNGGGLAAWGDGEGGDGLFEPGLVGLLDAGGDFQAAGFDAGVVKDDFEVPAAGTGGVGRGLMTIFFRQEAEGEGEDVLFFGGGDFFGGDQAVEDFAGLLFGEVEMAEG